ncbi:hypothetical protein K501DRAFT_244423 [Backusella circina FSU 941]|nr:hypothetical protein K501DRAFT_244423 [Backusella circina FSU 941]
MAFKFDWTEFDADFYKEAQSQLEAALNKGNKKTKNIVDYISVKELNMGAIAPELEVIEIGELSTDKFRGIFNLRYSGDASIVIQTKVQANPICTKQSSLPRHIRPSILAADQPLVVPILLRISQLKLRGIVVLVVSKTKGVTLVFKNDPLESILISSTFDSVTSVASFLQRGIEKQLRHLFQEDLPIMIHNLSQKHIQRKKQAIITEEEERVSVCSSASTTLCSSKNIPMTKANLTAWNELSPFTSLNIKTDNDTDIYTESSDITEGPRLQLPGKQEEEQVTTCTLHEETTLDPTLNGVTAKLAQLTCVHHTISPFSHQIKHATFRSFPHTTTIDASRKKSKRRIIRLF